MFISYQNGKIVGYTEQPQDLVLYNLDRVEETSQEYVYDDDMREYVLNDDEYKRRQEQKERERLDSKILTSSDVERALYYSDLQMDFEDLKALIKEKAPQIDLKGLAIEFRANNFYRGAVDKDGNRIIDMVGMLLGYTPDDMDYLFENKELPKKVQPEPIDTDSDTDTDTDTNYVHIGDNTDNMEVTTNNDEYINIGDTDTDTDTNTGMEVANE